MQENTIKVWDPLVRVFHWTLVGAFAVSYLTEDELLDLHVFSGYLIGGLILFRLLWGVVGTRHARFAGFVRGPGAVVAYLKEIAGLHPKRYLGHNPAGGAMVVALLAALVLTVVTGLATYGAAESAGPLAAWFAGWGEEGGEVFEEVHEFFANLTVLLVIAHVGGVLLASLQHRENLVLAMVTGRKRP